MKRLFTSNGQMQDEGVFQDTVLDFSISHKVATLTNRAPRTSTCTHQSSSFVFTPANGIYILFYDVRFNTHFKH
ncbi:hypothetical protein CICLE_v10033251mg [Citrus x clementina]|uniref:Uncharacterized protein n=1 Tax=Citrus clementina TaxID=85681 RepID=V4TEJ6_CITCL|nr:hypothetical protein CICLE_v10033251mg [Citrus x clementina]